MTIFFCCRTPEKLRKAVANLPNLVLAVASVDVPQLRCLTADLTSFDEDAGEATYTWHVKSPDSSKRTDVRINYALTGEGPDMCVAHINDDTTQKYASQVLYSDYKDCVLVRMLLGKKEVCFLWESKETAYAVPKNCLDAYKKSCGDGVTLYSKDACNAN
ncbi:uncharacterized protein [Dermacentor andersoni]|uniref:uncharacterized protein n=1 Tax=Dermacentor andersoni TaxID=34620 RepID=UPI002417A580|nr:uncharacterized protein LOC129382439 [Dermacentor andersoni]